MSNNPPDWVVLRRAMYRKLEEAKDDFETSKRLRCKVTDSHTAQCTMDAEPEHQHQCLEEFDQL